MFRSGNEASPASFRVSARTRHDSPHPEKGWPIDMYNTQEASERAGFEPALSDCRLVGVNQHPTANLSRLKYGMYID